MFFCTVVYAVVVATALALSKHLQGRVGDEGAFRWGVGGRAGSSPARKCLVSLSWRRTMWSGKSDKVVHIPGELSS